MPPNPYNQEPPNPLTLLTRALEPHAAQSTHPGTTASDLSGGMREGLLSIPSLGNSSIPSHPSHASPDEHDGSYGTLILNKRGISKYLGPTAASEWLKEVR